MIITTTLKLIKNHIPCREGFKTLISHLGKDYPEDKPINLLTILESNSLSIFFLAFTAAEQPFQDIKPTLINIASEIAESVLPIFEKIYPEDKRPREAIHAARKIADGDGSNPADARAAAALAAAAAYSAAACASVAASAACAAAACANAACANAAYGACTSAAYSAAACASVAASAASDAAASNAAACAAAAAAAAWSYAAYGARACAYSAEVKKQKEIINKYLTF